MSHRAMLWISLVVVGMGALLSAAEVLSAGRQAEQAAAINTLLNVAMGLVVMLVATHLLSAWTRPVVIRWLWLVAALVELLCNMSLWMRVYPFRPVGSYLVTEAAWWMVIFGCLGALALHHTDRAGRRWAGWCGYGAALGVMACEIIHLAAEAQRNGALANRLPFLQVVMVIYGVIGMTLLAGFDWRRRTHHWRWLAMACGLAGLGFCVASIMVFNAPRQLGPPMFATTAAAAMLAYVNLILLTPLQGWRRWLKWPTIAVGAISLGLWFLYMGADFSDPGHRIGRWIAVMMIGAGGWTAAIEALAWVPRIGGPAARTWWDEARVEMVCPHCEKRQTIDAGRSVCVACGLRFELRVQVPHCPHCNYLLYHLQGNTCPECGCLLPAHPRKVAAILPPVSGAAKE